MVQRGSDLFIHSLVYKFSLYGCHAQTSGRKAVSAPIGCCPSAQVGTREELAQRAQRDGQAGKEMSSCVCSLGVASGYFQWDEDPNAHLMTEGRPEVSYATMGDHLVFLQAMKLQKGDGESSKAEGKVSA